MNRKMKAKSGSDAFIWIPSPGKWQRHPFTLVISEPKAEFVVKARDNWTRRLDEKACKEPDIKPRAAVEGPCGAVPNLEEFENVVFTAGGSGGTFMVSLLR